jgi:hypothetical protein
MTPKGNRARTRPGFPSSICLRSPRPMAGSAASSSIREALPGRPGTHHSGRSGEIGAALASRHEDRDRQLAVSR